MVKRWLSLIFSHTKSVESILIGLTLWWSFMLILPTDLFHVDNQYRAMSGVAPEEVWSVLFFGVALLMFFGMIQDRKICRMAGQILAAGLWIYISGMFGTANNLLLAGTYFSVFLIQITVLYKVGEAHGD